LKIIVLKVLRKMKTNKFHEFWVALKKATLGIFYMSPMIFGILGLSALMLRFISPQQMKVVFTGNPLVDTVYGSFTGAIMVGNAMLGYILGAELLKMKISLYAVTAFLLAWVTLGFVQIPMEVSFFGKKFVLIRNLLAFIFTLIISILIVMTYEYF